MNKNDALIALMRMVDEYEEFGYVHSKLSTLYEIYNFISSLGEKNVDPETGLMPCGCGGKAIMLCDLEYAVACEKCLISLPYAFDTKELARQAWNAAMGYTEPPLPEDPK